MAERSIVKVEVSLEIYHCPCGCVYAVPAFLSRHKCPACAQRLLDEANADSSANLDDSWAKDRRIQSLRGVITKLRKQAGRPK